MSDFRPLNLLLPIEVRVSVNVVFLATYNVFLAADGDAISSCGQAICSRKGRQVVVAAIYVGQPVFREERGSFQGQATALVAAI